MSSGQPFSTFTSFTEEIVSREENQSNYLSPAINLLDVQQSDSLSSSKLDSLSSSKPCAAAFIASPSSSPKENLIPSFSKTSREKVGKTTKLSSIAVRSTKIEVFSRVGRVNNFLLLDENNHLLQPPVSHGSIGVDLSSAFNLVANSPKILMERSSQPFKTPHQN